MWAMFISNKKALRATQVAKPSVFCVKSFQAEWFLETAITMILFFIINVKPSAIEWNKNQMIFHKKNTRFSYESKWNL